MRNRIIEIGSIAGLCIASFMLGERLQRDKDYKKWDAALAPTTDPKPWFTETKIIRDGREATHIDYWDGRSCEYWHDDDGLMHYQCDPESIYVDTKTRTKSATFVISLGDPSKMICCPRRLGQNCLMCAFERENGTIVPAEEVCKP